LKRYILSIAMLALLAATLVACGGEAPMKEPEHITVQHILIGFKDAVGFQGNTPAKAAARTQDEAKELAYDLLAKAKAGEDFNKLVTENTDDSPPGIYSMSNNGVNPDQAAGEFSRGGMVPAFGNVGFTLKVGEIGISDYDPATSPYGWHIIKRVK
jgi:foldase protein PrsA